MKYLVQRKQNITFSKWTNVALKSFDQSQHWFIKFLQTPYSKSFVKKQPMKSMICRNLPKQYFFVMTTFGKAEYSNKLIFVTLILTRFDNAIYEQFIHTWIFWHATFHIRNIFFSFTSDFIPSLSTMPSKIYVAHLQTKINLKYFAIRPITVVARKLSSHCFNHFLLRIIN